jgi:isoamylase
MPLYAPTVPGFHCSHEQLPPSGLLRHARMAAAAGFTAVMCFRLRAEHPVFRRRRWPRGRPPANAGVSDIAWFRPDGQAMSDEDWQADHARSFAVFLNGDALCDVDEDGEPVRDDSFLLLFNAHHEPLAFTVPPGTFGTRWECVVETAAESDGTCRVHEAGEVTEVAGRCVVVLCRRRNHPARS